MSAAPRRPGISRHPVRAAAEAAREAEEQESAQDSPKASTPTVVSEAPAALATEKDHKPRATRNGSAAGSDGASEARQRLNNGRVSYAGRAVTIYFPSAEDKDRAQAAFAARGGIEGFTSASEWMADAVLERTEAWETEHNDGKPFTEVLARREARRRRA